VDHETRMAAARQQDPELCARIVRSIADLERDYLFAWGPLSERLMREAAAAFHKVAPEPWVVVGKDDGVSLRSPDWKLQRGIGDDAWLELGEVVDDEEATAGLRWWSALARRSSTSSSSSGRA